MTRILRSVVVLAGLLALTTTGCTKYGSVKGKIYYGTQALGGGTVQFVPAKGGAISGQIGEDGSYSVDKVPVGHVKIVVDTSSVKPVARPGGGSGIPTNAKLPDEAADDPMYSKNKAKSGKYVAIPDKYSNPNTTDEEYDVTVGSQEYDIKLK